MMSVSIFMLRISFTSVRQTNAKNLGVNGWHLRRMWTVSAMQINYTAGLEWWSSEVPIKWISRIQVYSKILMLGNDNCYILVQRPWKQHMKGIGVCVGYLLTRGKFHVSMTSSRWKTQMRWGLPGLRDEVFFQYFASVFKSVDISFSSNASCGWLATTVDCWSLKRLRKYRWSWSIKNRPVASHLRSFQNAHSMIIRCEWLWLK